ncbi:MAG: hypothetical protein ACLRFP_00560 [Alphaproteobacteria bacterium]
MCEMKCPICGTKLEYDIGYDGDYSCAKCGRAKMFGSEELWQALTDSMKEHDLCHDALVERTKELDLTRKALKIARSGLIDIFGYEGVPKYVAKHVRQVLDQSKIETALEQKD